MSTTQIINNTGNGGAAGWLEFPIPTYLGEFKFPYLNPFHFSDIPENDYSVFAYDIVGSRDLNLTDYNQIGALPVAEFMQRYPNSGSIYSHQGDGGIIAVPTENKEGFLESIRTCPYPVRVMELNLEGVQIGTAEYNGVESTIFIGGSLQNQLDTMKDVQSTGVVYHQRQTNIDEQNIVQYSRDINIGKDLACIFFQLNSISSTEEIKQLLEIIDTVFNAYPYQIHALTIEGNIVKITASSFEPWSKGAVATAVGESNHSNKIQVKAFYPYAGQTLTIATYPDGSQQLMPAGNGTSHTAYLEAAARSARSM